MSRTVFVAVTEPLGNWVEDRKVVYQERGKAWLAKFVADGTLVRAGRFTQAEAGGGLAVFTSREAAESYFEGDPFTRAGVMSAPEILEFIEVASA